PSYADALLALAVARSGAELEFTRLEESSPLQGGVRAPLARMTPRPITVQIPGEIAEPGDAAASAEAAASGTEERAATNEHGDTPEQPAPESWQVDLSLHGQAIGAHVITEGRLRASDYGAGASTLPAASQQQALDGLSADLQTFANLPR
ncbi:MAG: hypothetical protein Q4G34_09590, partial [Micrococcus sp.]|nr:hypothetical protein [Micrococcus sp.]